MSALATAVPEVPGGIMSVVWPSHRVTSTPFRSEAEPAWGTAGAGLGTSGVLGAGSSPPLRPHAADPKRSAAAVNAKHEASLFCDMRTLLQ
jgi:hypothetical protein